MVVLHVELELVVELVAEVDVVLVLDVELVAELEGRVHLAALVPRRDHSIGVLLPPQPSRLQLRLNLWGGPRREVQPQHFL